MLRRVERVPLPARLLALALAVLVPVAGIWAVVSSTSEPKPPPTAGHDGPPHVPIAVTVRLAGPEPMVGMPTPVTSHALSDTPLSALELWAGTERVAVHEADTASRALYTTFDWTPADEGEAILFARAIDVQGRVAQSSVARHRVAPAPSLEELAGTAAVPQAVLASTTVAETPSLAIAVPTLDVALDGCTAEVHVDTTSAIADGVTLLQLPPVAGAFLPIGSMPAPTQPTSHPVQMTAGPQLLMSAAYDGTAISYSDPVLVEGPDECAGTGWTGTARLVAGSLEVDEPADADVAYLYLSTDSGAAVRVPSDPETFLPRIGPGRFDASAHLPALAALSSLRIEAWGWRDGALVQLGRGSWQAASTGPSGDTSHQTAFISPPAVTQLTVAHKEIGAAASEPNMIKTGPVAEEVCLGSGEIHCAYRPVQEDEIVRRASGNYADPKRVFEWSTQMPGVTAVHWQVLPYAPPPSTDLTPPFLIAAGTVPVPDGTATEGHFSIDFTPWLPQAEDPEEPEPTEVGAEETKAAIGAALGMALLPPGAQEPMPANPFLDGGEAELGGDLSIGMLPAGVGQYGIQFGNSTFYVRVIPMQGATPALPSTVVRLDVVDFVYDPVEITVPHQEVLPPPDLTWEFTVPMALDTRFTRCAVIAELTDAFKPQQGNAAFWGLYEVYKDAYQDPNHRFCWDPPDDGWSLTDAFEAFVEFVADVVNFVSESYKAIKKAIVDALASSCDVIPGVSPEDCEPLAEAALTAVLASAGIPPSIPNFSQVVAGLKGDLAGAIVSLSGTLGFSDVCAAADVASAAGAPTCQELALAAIDELVEQVEAQQSKAAAKAAGVLPYPGVVFKPHPKGVWNPPTFVVTITNDGTEKTAGCHLTADLEATATFAWDELHYGGLKKLEPQKVTGWPFEPVEFSLPQLEPGESLTREVALTQMAEWYPNVEAKNAYGMKSGSYPYGLSWQLLTAGASLKATLRTTGGYPVTCIGDQKKGPFVLEVSGNQ